MIQVDTFVECRVCGTLEKVGRRTLDSTAELHTKTTGHPTIVWSTPRDAGQPPVKGSKERRDAQGDVPRQDRSGL